MTRPADDKDWTDLVAGYVLGNLTSEEAASLKQQLSDNPALAEDIVAFQETLSLLPYALSTVEPSANLKNKLLVAASQTESDPPLEAHASINVNARPLQIVPKRQSAPKVVPSVQALPSRPLRQLRRPMNNWSNGSRWIAGISASVAAVAIAALGVTQVQLNNQSQQTTDLQQQLNDKIAEADSLRNQLKETQTVTAFLGESATQVHSLVGPEGVKTEDNAPEGNDSEGNDSEGNDLEGNDSEGNEIIPSARLLAKAGEPEIVFVAQDLPQLAPEQIYRLWAVADDSSEPMYCGQFRQDSAGTARWTAPDKACTDGPAQLLITLDAPDDPITSAGPLVLQTDV